MGKITKFLNKRNKKERLLLMSLIEAIAKNKLDNLDLKKLKESKDIFRIRSGNFRVIFKMGDKKNFILAVDKRDEGTYKIY